MRHVLVFREGLILTNRPARSFDAPLFFTSSCPIQHGPEITFPLNPNSKLAHQRMENGTALMELTPETLGGQPMRNKRRPALACQECRRRKIRCDRRTPCGQCSKANAPSCSYVCDNRTTPTTAPFEAHDTHFSVLQQGAALPLSHDFSTTSLGIETSRTPSITSTHSPSGRDVGPLTGSSADMQPILPSHCLEWNGSAVVGPADMTLDLPLNHDADRLFPPPFQGGIETSIQGMFSKSRYLGQSHWKNFAQPVSREKGSPCLIHGQMLMRDCRC